MQPTDAAYAPYEHLRPPGRDPQRMLAQARAEWHRRAGPQRDLWVFGYASLIWRTDFDFTERHASRIHGWHRALAMWSRVNRGTPELPGLVFALLPGGSCQGLVFRVPHQHADAVLDTALTETAPWTKVLGAAPTDQRRARAWRKAARVVAAYRDRYRITGDAPLGAPPESAAQKIDAARARAALDRMLLLSAQSTPLEAGLNTVRRGQPQTGRSI